jgi:hypothetical protein
MGTPGLGMNGGIPAVKPGIGAGLTGAVPNNPMKPPVKPMIAPQGGIKVGGEHLTKFALQPTPRMTALAPPPQMPGAPMGGSPLDRWALPRIMPLRRPRARLFRNRWRLRPNKDSRARRRRPLRCRTLRRNRLPVNPPLGPPTPPMQQISLEQIMQHATVAAPRGRLSMK